MAPPDRRWIALPRCSSQRPGWISRFEFQTAKNETPSPSLRAKRSNPRLGIARSKMDCFVALLLAKTWMDFQIKFSNSRHIFASPRHEYARVLPDRSSLIEKGAGNA